MTKDKHRLLRRDLYLICILLAIAIVGILVLSLQTDGDHVSVSIAGEHYGDFPLNKNGESIICLPHQIVITVCRKNQTNIDIVV